MSEAPLFTGATFEPPRVWPKHVEEKSDPGGAKYIECRAKVCKLPARVQYVTPPGQRVVAGPALDEIWRKALDHAPCSSG